MEAFFRKEDEKEMVEDFRCNTLRSVKIFTDLVGKLLPGRNIDVPIEMVRLPLVRKFVANSMGCLNNIENSISQTEAKMAVPKMRSCLFQ